MTKTKRKLKKYEPTAEDRARVMVLRGCGLTDEELAKVIYWPVEDGELPRPIGEKTLQRHFRTELDAGGAHVHARVVGRFARTAMGLNPDAAPRDELTAQIFMLKTRYGWKEQVVHEHKGAGVLVAPAAVEPTDWVASETERSRMKPGSSSRN